MNPCAIFSVSGVDEFLPGDRTIERLGFGIVDTMEHPCCCTLIGAIDHLKDELIGDDP